MGVRIRQKGRKWYVFINHLGQRKAKCIGTDKRVALQVARQLEARLGTGSLLLNPSTSNRPGLLYVIGAAELSAVKIGSTFLSIETRLRQLQTAYPFALHVLALVPVERQVRTLEKRLHTIFASHRRFGEWFAIDIDQAHLEQLVTTLIATEKGDAYGHSLC